jgi:DNA repair exonuclease SbcCD ATPase subunit
VNARLRNTLVAPVRPLMKRLQVRIDNAAHAGDERREQRLQEVAGQLRDEQAAEAAVQHRLRDERLGELAGRVDELDDQLRRISAQLVAVEHRVGDLERPSVDLGADEADRREARSLIDEVRTQHGRAQANLAGVAFYEERIARLEQAGNGERPPLGS